MFVDECVIKVSAGDGGRGCISFRREKYEPWGGPNGGDGGAGGDVILLGSHDTNNLVDYKFKPHWRGERGEHGLGKDCNGREGKDAVLRLPLGTIVTDKSTGKVVAELVEDGQRIVLCKGGNGGWGNTHFKTSTNRAPKRANPGQVGESGEYRLVLKSIADVGLVGFPNAGKSTLVSRLSAARPKIADYPFTTLEPQLGVVSLDRFGGDIMDSWVIADIPGLIEGAANGAGLGIQFLRHVERTRMLLQLVDLSDPIEEPADAIRIIEGEVQAFSPVLAAKPRWLVGTKLDALQDESRREAFVALCAERGQQPIFISGVTGEGLRELAFAVDDALKVLAGQKAAAPKDEVW